MSARSSSSNKRTEFIFQRHSCEAAPSSDTSMDGQPRGHSDLCQFHQRSSRLNHHVEEARALGLRTCSTPGRTHRAHLHHQSRGTASVSADMDSRSPRTPRSMRTRQPATYPVSTGPAEEYCDVYGTPRWDAQPSSLLKKQSVEYSSTKAKESCFVPYVTTDFFTTCPDHAIVQTIEKDTNCRHSRCSGLEVDASRDREEELPPRDVPKCQSAKEMPRTYSRGESLSKSPSQPARTCRASERFLTNEIPTREYDEPKQSMYLEEPKPATFLEVAKNLIRKPSAVITQMSKSLACRDSENPDIAERSQMSCARSFLGTSLDEAILDFLSGFQVYTAEDNTSQSRESKVELKVIKWLNAQYRALGQDYIQSKTYPEQAVASRSMECLAERKRLLDSLRETIGIKKDSTCKCAKSIMDEGMVN